MATSNNGKRPCCILLRELSQAADRLKDPSTAERALETITQHCVLIKLAGEKRTKLDLTASTCYLDVNPDSAQVVVDEAGKTLAVSTGFENCFAALAKINQVIAHNANLQQISDRMQLFLAQMRDGEKRFGRVPDTSLLKEMKNENVLQAGDLLQAHPKLEKSTQFDGMNPKSTADPRQNPEAEKNTQDLQNRLELQYRPQPAFNPKPKTPGQG